MLGVERGLAEAALEGAHARGRGDGRRRVLATLLAVARGLVRLQQVQQLEAGAAEAAGPRQLAGSTGPGLVRAAVRHEVLPATETAAALVALEGPLSRVRAQVAAQVVADCEAG